MRLCGERLARGYSQVMSFAMQPAEGQGGDNYEKDSLEQVALSIRKVKHPAVVLWTWR